MLFVFIRLSLQVVDNVFFKSYLYTAIIRVVGNTCHLYSYSYLTDSRQYLFHLTFIRLSYR